MVPTLGNDPSESYDSGFTDHPLSLSEYVGIYGLGYWSRTNIWRFQVSPENRFPQAQIYLTSLTVRCTVEEGY